MHTLKVTFKDGTTLSGVLWTFRPQDGWLSMTGCTHPYYDGKILPLEYMVSAIEENVRVSIHVTKDLDLLEDAREKGWDGGAAHPRAEPGTLSKEELDDFLRSKGCIPQPQLDEFCQSVIPNWTKP